MKMTNPNQSTAYEDGASCITSVPYKGHEITIYYGRYNARISTYVPGVMGLYADLTQDKSVCLTQVVGLVEENSQVPFTAENFKAIMKWIDTQP